MNCYVLAGGRSIRFGSPKSEALWEGRTFLERVQAAAMTAFAEVWYVGQEPLPHIPQAQMLIDTPHPAGAAIFGIQRALEHSVEEKFWIVAIDFPLITAAALSHLRDIFDSAKAQLVVPEWHGFPQMLCGGYSRSLGPLIEEQIEKGEWKLQALLPRVPSRVVPEIELRKTIAGEPFWNINDPVELEKARREYGQ